MGVWDRKACVPKMARPDFPNGKFRFFPRWSLWSGRGGGLAQGLGIRLFTFGGAYWPFATAHSDSLWVRTKGGGGVQGGCPLLLRCTAVLILPWGAEGGG